MMALFSFFLRQFEKLKWSPKIVQQSIKIYSYNNANKAKYSLEQYEKT